MKNINEERTRWACRRGMLELDLFLVPFFENCYQSLLPTEHQIFMKFLQETDPQLLEWLMGNAQAPMEYGPIVEKIRNFRLKRSTTLF